MDRLSRTRNSLTSFMLPLVFGLGIALALGAPGCGRDNPADSGDPGDPPGDVPAPVIQTITPEAGSFLTGVVTFAIQATDVATYTLAVDGTAAVSGPPPLVWDSRTVANGAHSLVVTAVNTTGTAARTLEVMTDNEGKGIVVLVSSSATELDPGTTATFQARVLGTANQSVTWSVLEGAAAGSITSAGVFTAPATVTDGIEATIVATSVAEPTAVGQKRIALKPGLPPVLVEISPTMATVATGATQHFKATVGSTTDTRVTWSIADGGPGTINIYGLYTAPANLPAGAEIRVVATSVANPANSAAADVSLREELVPGEAAQIEILIQSGYRCEQISDQIVDMAADFLDVAYRANGNVPTRSGTLHSIGNGRYTITGANTSEKLILDDPIRPIEMTVTALAGAPFYAERVTPKVLSGSDVVGIIAGRIVLPGILDATIQHEGEEASYGVDFYRSITATLSDGPIRQMALSHTGYFSGTSPHVSSVTHTIDGTAVTDQGYALQLDESSEFSYGENCYSSSGSMHHGWHYTLANTAQIGPFAVSLNGTLQGSVQGCGPGGPNYAGNVWLATGGVTRNGAPYGEVRLSRSVGTEFGAVPNTVLDIGGNEVMVLLESGLPVIDIALENPFR